MQVRFSLGEADHQAYKHRHARAQPVGERHEGGVALTRSTSEVGKEIVEDPLLLGLDAGLHLDSARRESKAVVTRVGWLR